MRIWYLAPRELDNKRLVAFHHETHIIWNKVTKGQKWVGWENPQYWFHLHTIHDCIEDEMIFRGMHPSSPIPVPDEPRGGDVAFPFTPEQVEADRWALVCRWQGQYLGRDPMPQEYSSLLKKYYTQGNKCLHELGLTSDMICKLCKRKVNDT